MTQRFLFSGRVQGVGFRWTVSRLASDYPVTGYVRNLNDGRVELLVAGERSAIDRLIVAVKNRFSQNIESVEQSDVEADQHFATFEIRH